MAQLAVALPASVVFIGPVDRIVEVMHERRERYGFSYCDSARPRHRGGRADRGSPRRPVITRQLREPATRSATEAQEIA
jgi:hypothetical protein